MSEGKPEWLLGQHDEGPGNKVWNIPRLRQHGSKHEMHEKPTLETRRQKDGMPPMHQKAYHSPALSNQEHVNDSAMHVWALGSKVSGGYAVEAARPCCHSDGIDFGLIGSNCLATFATWVAAL